MTIEGKDEPPRFDDSPPVWWLGVEVLVALAFVVWFAWIGWSNAFEAVVELSSSPALAPVRLQWFDGVW